MKRKKAVAIVARELKLQKCKAGLWNKSLALSQISNNSCERVYAQLRLRELVDEVVVVERLSEDFGEVIPALRERTLQFVWEGGLFMLLSCAMVMGSIKLVI